MKNKFYISTPIYYVNAEPHIGHSYTTVAADVLARYYKMMGKKVFFATGTDEHGTKIAQKAKEAGKEPQVFANEVAAKFSLAWDEINISNNRFIRTTEAKHKKAVQRALQYMYDKGDIYLDKYEGLYCEGCEQFKNEKDLLHGKCPDHNIAPKLMSEETYMFKMEKYGKKLEKLIACDELKIRPLERKNEVLSFYKNGLRDVSFSRQNVKWGITLPWDESHTAYVWSDAFLNYLTILNWDGRGGSSSPSFEEERTPELKFWPPDLQLMSKDILRVHASIWPAMLLSLDIPLQKKIFVHGFFLIDGQKMSKSIGNVISPNDLKDRYGTDGARYLLMSAAVFGRDGDIGWQKFDKKYNADLANGLGNLMARTIAMVLKLRKNKGELKKSTDCFNTKKVFEHYANFLNKTAIDSALKEVWKIINKCDQYISTTEPYRLISSDKDRAGEILYQCLETIRIIALLIYPFMPETTEKLITGLGSSFTEELKISLDKNIKFGKLKINAEIKKGEALFPRL